MGDTKDAGKGGSGALGAVTRKTPITGKVLQVWEDALLFTGSKNAVFILTGHPNQRTIADGNEVNCYAIETDEVRKYTDVKGAKRTARVYRYHSRRIGK